MAKPDISRINEKLHVLIIQYCNKKKTSVNRMVCEGRIAHHIYDVLAKYKTRPRDIRLSTFLGIAEALEVSPEELLALVTNEEDKKN